MKSYIAGITLENSNHLNTYEKSVLLTQTFDQIERDANYYMGEDARIIVVLHEYALAGKSGIDKDMKDACLAWFKKCLENFPRMILVPGSFAYYSELTDKQIDKLEQVYQHPVSTHAKHEKEHFEEVRYEFDTRYYLSNAAWLLFSDKGEVKKHKHKKINPYMERDGLSPAMKARTAFLAGLEPKSVQVPNGNTGTSKMGLLICYDHSLPDEHTFATRKNASNRYADTVILVSNWIPLRLNKLTSPMTIHMDQKTRLRVHTNAKHPDYDPKCQNYAAVNYSLNLEHGMRKKPVLQGGHGDLLRWAILKRDHEILAKALEVMGEEVNDCHDRAGSPLHIAIRKDDIEITKILLQHKNIEVDVRDVDGATPLMVAVEWRNIAICQLLIDAGASLSVINKQKESLMHYAVKNKGTETLLYLLLCNVDINLFDKNKNTPLMMAMKYQDKDVFKCLLDARADVNVCNARQLTILHQAVLNEDKDAVKLLLERDDIVVNSLDEYGVTPLMTALELEDPEIFEMLLAKGADVSIKDEDGMTILHLAILQKNNDLAIAVYSIMPDLLNVPANRGHTPLAMAKTRNMVKFLEFVEDKSIQPSTPGRPERGR